MKNKNRKKSFSQYISVAFFIKLFIKLSETK